MDHHDNEHEHDSDHSSEHGDEPTQGENPGAQGDFGAGQGDDESSESIADIETADENFDGNRVEGTDQPRSDDVDGGGAI